MKRLTKICYSLFGLFVALYASGTFYLFFIDLPPAWLSPVMLYWAYGIGSGLCFGVGLWLLAKGLLSRRKHPVLATAQDGGCIMITQKALKNLTYNAIETFPGVLEDRVRVTISRKGGVPGARIKAWIGTSEASTLPAQHQAIRARIAQAYSVCTGVEAHRIDLVFYNAPGGKNTTQGGNG